MLCSQVKVTRTGHFCPSGKGLSLPWFRQAAACAISSRAPVTLPACRLGALPQGLACACQLLGFCGPGVWATGIKGTKSDLPYGPLSDLESTRSQGGRGYLLGRLWAGPFRRVLQDCRRTHSALLEYPACSGDTEMPQLSPLPTTLLCHHRTPIPVTAQQLLVNVSGRAHFPLSPHNLPLRKMLLTPSRMRILRLGRAWEGSHSWEGSRQDPGEIHLPQRLSPQQLCSSWGDNVDVDPLNWCLMDTLPQPSGSHELSDPKSKSAVWPPDRIDISHSRITDYEKMAQLLAAQEASYTAPGMSACFFYFFFFY